MSLSPFQRLLEDTLREEIANTGVAYEDVVESISEQRDGGVYMIRFRGEEHDLDVVEPEELPSRNALSATLSRKIKQVIERIRLSRRASPR